MAVTAQQELRKDGIEKSLLMILQELPSTLPTPLPTPAGRDCAQLVTDYIFQNGGG